MKSNDTNQNMRSRLFVRFSPKELIRSASAWSFTHSELSNDIKIES